MDTGSDDANHDNFSTNSSIGSIASMNFGSDDSNYENASPNESILSMDHPGLDESSNESMLDVIARAHAYLGAAYSASEWSSRSSSSMVTSVGEPSTSYGSAASISSGLSHRDSGDSVVLETFSDHSTDGSLIGGHRRRRAADGIPVTASVSIDDTLNELLEVDVPTPPPSRKPAVPAIEVSCPICFESVFVKRAASTVCGHMFCHSCIMREVGIRRKCPMCQRQLNASQVIPIFMN